jgi:hypothetical protein
MIIGWYKCFGRKLWESNRAFGKTDGSSVSRSVVRDDSGIIAQASKILDGANMVALFQL